MHEAPARFSVPQSVRFLADSTFHGPDDQPDPASAAVVVEHPGKWQCFRHNRWPFNLPIMDINARARGLMRVPFPSARPTASGILKRS
jgi:hypothetical protein